MRWFALGLKLRLETESPGGGFTCTERRKPSIESARAEGFHHLDRGRQVMAMHAHVPRGIYWGWGWLRRRC
jgi:hypothetical protein